MQRRILILPAMVALLGFATPTTRGAEPLWQAGAASCAITPDGPMWMGGYASRTKPSEGKVHDLFAKALVLEDARKTGRFVILTADLLVITPELRSAVEDQVKARYGLPAGALLMNASHTHCGPEIRDRMILQRNGTPEFAAKARRYVDQLVVKIVELIGQAIDNMQPSTLTYSYARAGFAMNRRLPTPEGVQNRPYPDGPVDHQVPVLRVESEEGRLLAVLFGYACHNTTLSFQLFCGDYAGFAQAYLEEAHPSAVAMFVTGCGADQNPYPRRTLQLAQQHGRALANAVQTALQTESTTAIHGPIRSELAYVNLEFATPPSRQELVRRIENESGRTVEHALRLLEQFDRKGSLPSECAFPLQAVQFGDDLTIVAICGETVVDYSLRLKRDLRLSPDGPDAASGPVIWVAGYSNHVFGYLPSRRVLEEGGYEGARAMLNTNYPGPFAPSVEERVVGKVKELVRRVRTTPSSGAKP